MHMPRIQPLRIEEANDSARLVLEDLRRQRGKAPNMFRTMALRPEIMTTAVAHMEAIYGTGTVDRKVKELVTVRVSQINECAY